MSKEVPANRKIPEKFLKPYDPTDVEMNIYEKWLADGFFNPDVCVQKGLTNPNAECFSMVLPPPNVTGTLHTGHAAMLAIEDSIIRFNRMSGKKTLWLPGTDHAAIATQTKVEKLLQKEGLRRSDLGREKFLERVNKFAQESHDTIANQIKRMGGSVDWSREAFTLDVDRQSAVYAAFKKMYDNGLIYRGHRIVNWDPRGQTTISDDEVIRVEEKTNFYYLKYGPFTIATARPETKFGDKYVVMHPDDKRYSDYKQGQKIDLEWINGPITATVIKDESIDMNFGSGVMTITPWHDATDFSIAERHNLDKEQIIDRYGKLLPIAGEFAGMKINEARPKIIEKLQQKGLVEKIEENYVHSVATAERSGGTIEPQIMHQWFIDVDKKFWRGLRRVSLKKLMRDAVSGGSIKILPERFEKIYYNWIDNLHDWCISRQIWYGHRIPVWYRNEEIFVGTVAPDGEGWAQDEDTLDTWFSSGLWTFSTLGWPNQTADFKNYHPTDLLETGYDIIFFWVARMILMSSYLLGEIPFKTVYLHGMVRDGQGRKVSKSLGNAIDPTEVAEKYGADAVRMSLIVGIGPGNDINHTEDKIRAYKKFANKIWNATRFVLENVSDFDFENNFDFSNLDRANLHPEDRQKFEELDKLIIDVTEDMKKYRLYLASEKLYHYFWHNFADIIIENSKPQMLGDDPARRTSSQKMLYHILITMLKMLHPFMPFVTEEIWQSLPSRDTDSLVISPWPKTNHKQ